MAKPSPTTWLGWSRPAAAASELSRHHLVALTQGEETPLNIDTGHTPTGRQQWGGAGIHAAATSLADPQGAALASELHQGLWGAARANHTIENQAWGEAEWCWTA